jgi:hypothetical protein
MRSKDGKLTPILLWKQRLPSGYKKRFRLHEVADATVRARFQHHFQIRLAQAVATARR